MSNRIPVTEASFEIDPGGRLRFSYSEVPAGRNRSEPPSRGEAIAALAKYRNRRMTDEQHRAVLEVLAACGALPPESLGRSGRSERPGDALRPARRHFHGQSDTSAPQSDGFGAQGDGSGP